MSTMDTIGLLKSLQAFCYDVKFRPANGTVELVRKMQQFLACEQKPGQRVADYIAEVRSYYNVLKLTGGASVFHNKVAMEETIELQFPEFRGTEFDSLSNEDKEKIEDAIDKMMIANTIMDGSKSSWKNRQVIEQAKIAG